jgi:FkbM family methyltransferase
MEVIDFDSCVSRAIITYGEWAQDEIDLIGGFLRPGSCVFDIGAFIGTHTLAFSRLVGEQGKVYSFEPRREIFDILTKNIELNSLGNVTAFNAAVSYELSNVGLSSLSQSDDANLGGLALYDPPNVSRDVDYSVKVVSIDSLAIDHLDLIKIDVEGMEDSVINGAVETIKKHRPIIFAECNSLNSGIKILSLSDRYDYVVFGVLTNAFSPANFNRIDENYFADAKELGLLMIPTERLSEFVDVLANRSLPQIGDADALAMILLHKPQYYEEVLKGTSTGMLLGLSIPLPAEFNVTRISHCVIDESREELRALADAKSSAESMAHERLADVQRLQEELRALADAKSSAESMAHERLADVQRLQEELMASNIAQARADATACAQHLELEQLRNSFWKRLFYH